MGMISGYFGSTGGVIGNAVGQVSGTSSIPYTYPGYPGQVYPGQASLTATQASQLANLQVKREPKTMQEIIDAEVAKLSS